MTIDTFIGSWTDKDLLSRVDNLPKFRSLVIYGRGFTDEGAELLTRCTQLKELHLLDTSISDEGLRNIGRLRSLDWLVLDNAAVSNQGLHHLGDLRQLNGLHICSTAAGDDGFSMLLNMPKLTYLEATGQNLRKSISIMSQLPELLTLRLSSSTADDRDFAQLGFTRSLRSLNFDMPLVTSEAVAELDARLTSCWLGRFRFFKPEDRITYLSGYCLELYEQREYDLARTAVDDVLRWLPFNPAAHGARAFINFQLGNYQEFRKDMESVRDNASVFGEEQLYQMARYYLMLESTQAVRIEIESSQPQSLLIERLRATTQQKKKKEDPALALIQRFEGLTHTTADPIIRIPTPAEVMLAQKASYTDFIQNLLNRVNKEKTEPSRVPWRW
jgi:hypothetical protein